MTHNVPREKRRGEFLNRRTFKKEELWQHTILVHAEEPEKNE